MIVVILSSMFSRLEPIMLKNLPIIPSRTSQNFTNYSYFIPIAPPIVLFYSIVPMIISQCRSVLIEYLTVLLEYLYLGGRYVFGWAWVLPGMPMAMPLFETNVSHV